MQVIDPSPGIGGMFGQGLGQGLQAGFQKYFEQKENKKNVGSLINAFYPQATDQDKSVIAKAFEGISPKDFMTIHEKFQPSFNFEPQQQSQSPFQEAQPSLGAAQQGQQETPESPIQKMQQPEAAQPRQIKALSPKPDPKVAQQNFTSNNKVFEDARDKSFALKTDEARLGRLEKLSESGKLPGALFSRFNIGEGGNVRFPSLFSKEGQEFVKLIVDFSKGAKDSYGGRITNFELGTFLQSLPSLLQTPEGRKAVLNDLKVINEMNQLHSEATLDAAKKVGLRSDPAQFQEYINQKIGPKIEKLHQKFVDPDQFGPAKLTKDIMQDFLKKAPGDTPEQKIKNAKKLASQAGYQ